MKKILYILFLLASIVGSAQKIGSVKTEEYKADFEKKQSLEVVSDYSGDIVIPIQILKIGINEESTNRFKFTEDREEIKQKMIAQHIASAKGISENKIEVKGNVILAKYFVYIEVYDFSIGEDEEVSTSGAEIRQKTILGLQVRFVDAQSGEIITGSGSGEAVTVKKANLLDGLDDIKFNQSTIGVSTKKSLETASSRVVSKMIKKGIFPN